MDDAHKKAVETGRRNRERRKAREAQIREAKELDKPLIVEALRAVLSAPDATATQRIFAVMALDEIGGYNLIPYKATRMIRDGDPGLIADFAEQVKAYMMTDNK